MRASIYNARDIVLYIELTAYSGWFTWKRKRSFKSRKQEASYPINVHGSNRAKKSWDWTKMAEEEKRSTTAPGRTATPLGVSIGPISAHNAALSSHTFFLPRAPRRARCRHTAATDNEMRNRREEWKGGGRKGPAKEARKRNRPFFSVQRQNSQYQSRTHACDCLGNSETKNHNHTISFIRTVLFWSSPKIHVINIEGRAI